MFVKPVKSTITKLVYKNENTYQDIPFSRLIEPVKRIKKNKTQTCSTPVREQDGCSTDGCATIDENQPSHDQDGNVIVYDWSDSVTQRLFLFLFLFDWLFDWNLF